VNGWSLTYEGFLPPEELVPSLLLGTAKCDFENGQFQDAEAVLVRLLKEYPKGGAAPEALYLLGVTRYKAFHDPKPLKDAYERLHVEYPGSEWEKRAYPYRLL
jgi:TolA-binding protein